MDQRCDDDPAVIDKIAIIQNYFKGNGPTEQIVNSYADGTLQLSDAVRQLAEPIEHAYTTADGGRQLVVEEKSARYQRKVWNKHPSSKYQSVLEAWGPEEDLEELEARVTDDKDAPTTEGLLWNLYYSILHAAKKIPWKDEKAQERLVDLVRALKTRPNPPHPAYMTTALKRYWIYDNGRENLWSSLIMLGPSARESWNDAPGCGAGWYKPEVIAWTNVNAFVARLASADLANFTHFGSWAIDDALNNKIKVNKNGQACFPTEYMAKSQFGVALVWIQLAGQYMLENALPDGNNDQPRPHNVISKSQWDNWCSDFEQESEGIKYNEKTTQLAKVCADYMHEIENRVREQVA